MAATAVEPSDDCLDNGGRAANDQIRTPVTSDEEDDSDPPADGAGMAGDRIQTDEGRGRDQIWSDLDGPN